MNWGPFFRHFFHVKEPGMERSLGVSSKGRSFLWDWQVSKEKPVWLLLVRDTNHTMPYNGQGLHASYITKFPKHDFRYISWSNHSNSCMDSSSLRCINHLLSATRISMAWTKVFCLSHGISGYLSDGTASTVKRDALLRKVLWSSSKLRLVDLLKASCQKNTIGCSKGVNDSMNSYVNMKSTNTWKCICIYTYIVIYL